MSACVSDTANINTRAISLIVPIYNQEQWLMRCFASIDAQTFFAFETILVDDGSNDATARIVSHYVANHDNVTLITHDTCRGLSAARNTGIAHAKGDYIAFLDSDDWAEPSFLKTLYLAAVENDADVAQVAYVESTSLCEPQQPEEEIISILTGEEAAEAMLNDDKYAVWCRLYRRSLVEALGEEPFEVGLTCEDRVFNMRILPKAGKVAQSNCVEYHYFQNMGSLSNGGLSEKGLDLLQADNLMVEAAKDTGNETLIELAKDRQAKGAYSLLVKWARFGFAGESCKAESGDEEAKSDTVEGTEESEVSEEAEAAEVENASAEADTKDEFEEPAQEEPPDGEQDVSEEVPLDGEQGEDEQAPAADDQDAGEQVPAVGVQSGANEMLSMLRQRYIADYPRLMKSNISGTKKFVAWQLRYMPSVLKAEFSVYNALQRLKRGLQ